MKKLNAVSQRQQLSVFRSSLAGWPEWESVTDSPSSSHHSRAGERGGGYGNYPDSARVHVRAYTRVVHRIDEDSTLRPPIRVVNALGPGQWGPPTHPARQSFRETLGGLNGRPTCPPRCRNSTHTRTHMQLRHPPDPTTWPPSSPLPSPTHTHTPSPPPTPPSPSVNDDDRVRPHLG